MNSEGDFILNSEQTLRIQTSSGAFTSTSENQHQLLQME